MNSFYFSLPECPRLSFIIVNFYTFPLFEINPLNPSIGTLVEPVLNYRNNLSSSCDSLLIAYQNH
jgi:hypothetical protein